MGTSEVTVPELRAICSDSAQLAVRPAEKSKSMPDSQLQSPRGGQ